MQGSKSIQFSTASGVLALYSILGGFSPAAQSGCLSDPTQECAFLWHQPSGSELFERFVDPSTGRPLVARESAPGVESRLERLNGGSESDDEVLRGIANPLRGRLTPSRQPGVEGFLRYHTADLVVNGASGAVPDFVDNPYLADPDEFPAELLPILPPQLVIPGTTTRGTFLLNNGSPAILTDDTAQAFSNFGSNAYGGDFSGIVLCVQPGGLLEHEQLGGSAPQPGCLPFENRRAIGGFGELPLRPAPDLSVLSANPSLLAQGLFIPRSAGGDPVGSCANAAVMDARDLDSVTAAGIGTDADCLMPGFPFLGEAQNALEFHHANQQLFARLCFDTIGSEFLDVASCAQTVFNSSERFLGFRFLGIDLPISEVISVNLSGDYRANAFFSALADAISGSGLPAATATPTQSLNRDANDGFITALYGTAMDCSGSPGGPSAQGCGNGTSSQNGGINQLPTTGFSNTNSDGDAAGNLLAKLLPSRDDFITLDSGLTSEQRAMFGCGPLWGTRCDSAASMRDFDCTGQQGCQNIALTRALFFDQVLPGSLQRGGGIDLLNADPVIFSAFPGIDEVDDDHITTSMAPGPGTVFDDLSASFCERPDPQTGEPTRLPGCRGIDSYEITPTEVIFTFEDNYDPSVDGCLVAPTIGSGANLHTVRTVYADGTDFTSSAGMLSCFGQLAPQTGDFDPNGPVVSTFTPCAAFVNDSTCQSQIAEYLNKANSDSSRGNYRSSARDNEPVYIVNFQSASTLYHPLAGCLSDDQIATQLTARPVFGPRCNSRPIIPGVLHPAPTPARCEELVSGCEPREGLTGFYLPASAGGELARDFDEEFLSGTAQIFKNELALASWNLLMFTVMASACGDEFEGDVDPLCFDPTRPFALDRCSFNQPQHCRTSQSYLALTNVPEPGSNALSAYALLAIGALVELRKRSATGPRPG